MLNMAKVKCEYCDEYMLDTDEVCSNCGAVNQNHHRTAKSTPQTIEELKQWYTDHNLPPEETTRFFIGKDIREPRAFGIYENRGTFIVYKNKTDGSRAVRYKGTDEAYAVNELYLRLKQEILNQKNINIQKKANHSAPVITTSTQRRARSCFIPFIIPFLFMIFFSAMALLPFLSSILKTYTELQTGEYYLNGNDLYYCDRTYENSTKIYEWWKYNTEIQDWELSQTRNNGSFIEGMTNEDNLLDSILDAQATLDPQMDSDEFYNKYSIYYSKAYVDAGHHYEPSDGYYETDNEFYYYLSDRYGEEYGTKDNSGWYKFVDGNWEYYCDYNDKEAIGEDLWYKNDALRVGSYYESVSIDYDFSDSQWYITDFESTQYYKDVATAEEAYDAHIDSIREENDDDWWDSDDDDYNWDDDYDWDTGGTDWDSDW